MAEMRDATWSYGADVATLRVHAVGEGDDHAMRGQLDSDTG